MKAEEWNGHVMNACLGAALVVVWLHDKLERYAEKRRRQLPKAKVEASR